MVKWAENGIPKSDCAEYLSLMDADTIQKIRRFHKSFPQYSVTPLCLLRRLAEKLGVGGIYVKDESYRFGLGSFKALGCTFAIANYIAGMLNLPVWDLNYNTLPDAAKKLGDITLYAATDGNHGRAVAWAARELKQKAVICMNKGCPQIRYEHILREHAEVSITNMNYDDTIRFIRKLAAQTPNSIIIQDTSWEGYVDIPGSIMQGYAVMVLEAYEQLDEMSAKRPSHVILQAGVGAFAGSAQAFITNLCGQDAPVSFITEPNAAACYYKSILNGDGSPVSVKGDMKTIMAGLACGEPSIIAWEIIKNNTIFYTTIDDCHTENAMYVLAHPLPGDTKITSGQSGASGMGFLLELMTNDNLAPLRRKAGIDGNSHILLFNTEGDTDPDSYNRIINDKTIMRRVAANGL